MNTDNNSYKLKIISDGTTTGTKLINSNTGEVISCVQEITWTCKADSLLATCFVTLCNVEIDAVNVSFKDENI